ncbi:MAG: Spy/CpxP family protein refolding chaperone [Acidobacteriia bacterium]|nr:Spy/CpxP family protein refolding chaperone [Terriglobia bacterium]
MKRWLGVALVAAVSLVALALVTRAQEFEAGAQDVGPMVRAGEPMEHLGGPMEHMAGPGRFMVRREFDHGFGPGHEMGQHLLAMLENDRVKAYLNLSEPQAQQLRKIVVDNEKSSVQTRAQLEVRGIELREMLRADQLDGDAVMKKVQEISDLRGQEMKQHIQALLEAQKVLTPEQRKKIRQFIENREAFGMRNRTFGEHRGFTARPHEGPGTPPAPTPRPGEPPVN